MDRTNEVSAAAEAVRRGERSSLRTLLREVAQHLDGVPSAPPSPAGHQPPTVLEEAMTLTFELLAHDLRAPLVSSRSALDRLRSRPGVEHRSPDAQVLEAVAEMLGRLDEVMDRLLTVEHLEVGSWSSRVRVDQIARRTVGSCSAPVRVGVLALPATSAGDAALIGSSIGNLVENALEQSRGRVTVLVGPARGGCLVVVDDEGPGVPAAVRELVFRPFVRLRDGDGGGLGLGLSLVHRVALLHGGRCWVTDAPGGGARFCLWLPRAACLRSGSRGVVER